VPLDTTLGQRDNPAQTAVNNTGTAIGYLKGIANNVNGLAAANNFMGVRAQTVRSVQNVLVSLISSGTGVAISAVNPDKAIVILNTSIAGTSATTVRAVLQNSTTVRVYGPSHMPIEFTVIEYW